MSSALLNQNCQCTTLRAEALQQAWHSHVGADLPFAGYFAPYGVFLNAAQAEALRATVRLLHEVAHRPEVMAAVAAEQAAPLPRSGTSGVLMGYDFHFDGDTPRLIEINTNAGGALLNALLLQHQQSCCAYAPADTLDCDDTTGRGFLDMFRAEWRAAGRAGEPARVAIVDAAPAQQFLYPEFRLFQRLFAGAGWDAVIADPADLERRDGRLYCQGEPVDFVYNRLTDFALAAPAQAALREAWRAGEVVVSPDPWHHALQADKRHLAHLSDPAWLAAHGIDAATAAHLAAIVPATQRVTAGSAAALWATRKQYFFKPLRGYGSKAAYRGDKLTRGTWDGIVASDDYVAQAYAPPGSRRVNVDGELKEMKFDIRCYAYAGEVLLIAARVYQGQATNMRTPGGGFAAVFSPSRAAQE
ncbi:MAG: hypothetical protein V4729_10890 [Pseudomonadota bacterium]